MPFQSQKQAAYLKYNEPEVFNRWKAEAHAKKKGSRVSKMQPRYGGAGTRGRRITDDDDPIGVISKKSDLSNEQKADRAKRVAYGGTALGAVGGLTGGYRGQAAALEGHKVMHQMMNRQNRKAAQAGTKKPFSLPAKVAAHGMFGPAVAVHHLPTGAATVGEAVALGSIPVALHYRRKAAAQARAKAAASESVGKADLSFAERTERARAGRRTRRQGAGVAAAGLGTVGASEVHRYVEASRGSRNPITTLPPGRPSTTEQMVRIPQQIKSSYNLQQLGNSKSKVSFGNRLKAAGKDVKTIARHSPHGAVAYGGLGAIAAGDAMMIGGRARTAHHNAKMMEMRRQRAVASKRDDSRSGTQKTADRARATAEVGGAGMLASSLAPGSVRQAQHIIRDTKKDTGSIKGRPALHQAKLRGANALLDITHRPRGAALLGSGALLAGATPVAVGARLKARHDRKVRKVAGVDYSWMKDATEPPRDPFNPNRRVKGPRSDFGARETRAIGQKLNRLSASRKALRFGKAERYYDPEHTRQRRIGAAEAGLALAGATGAGIGGRQIYRDTKDLRKIKVRGPHRTPDTPLKGHPDASGAFRIRRLPAGLAVGGATALGGAGYLHRRASTRRGAAYR